MSNEIVILAERDGETERLFKKQLIDLFHKSRKRLRVYLALVRYDMPPDMHVALLIKTETSGEDEFLLNKCQRIFTEMFSETQHLDIIFITDELEQVVRKVCCPFYTSPDFNVTIPDFYLYSHEGYHLDDVICARTYMLTVRMGICCVTLILRSTANFMV
jgi:hypothetical protein